MKTIAWNIMLMTLFPLVFLTSGDRHTGQSKPIEWPAVTDVRASQSGTQLLISWKSASEPAELIYSVEVSDDCARFHKTGIVLGGFRKADQYEYLFKATLKKGGNQCYRIVQERKDEIVVAVEGKF